MRICGSIPLVAKYGANGCGCKQLTIESSPFKTRTTFVVNLSQIKNDPSSDPAQMKFLFFRKKIRKLTSCL